MAVRSKLAPSELLPALLYDGDLITEALDRWAQKSPDHTFIYYGERDLTLTYGEAALLTDSIAGNLAGHGVGRGDHICVFSLNPYVSSLCMFGIWKAAAVYCPVNTNYGGHMLSYQLKDTKPSVLIVDESLLPLVDEIWADLNVKPLLIVHFDSGGNPAAQSDRMVVDYQTLLEGADRPEVALAWNDVANVIYTSGTTGPSKGVVQTHRWINHYTFFLRQLLTPTDVVYCDLPMYHIGGALALVGRAAWAGASISMWNRFSSSEFWRRIAASKATVAILVDVMTSWINSAPAKPSDIDNTLSLVTVQPVPADHENFCRRFGIDYLFVAFGQSEAGCPILALIDERPDGVEPSPSTMLRTEIVTELCDRFDLKLLPSSEVTRGGLLGAVNPFLEGTVVDEHGSECEPGKAGELVLRPRAAIPGMMIREYLDKPEATAQGFRECWWHTGDAATKEVDGLMYFVDRLGDRIRVRGENISSAHIEDVMRKHPSVSLCAAFAVPSLDGYEDDVVVVIQPASPGMPPTEPELRQWATDQLPKFMRPHHIFVLEEIPMTPTNKVEKYKLRLEALERLGRQPNRPG